MEHVKVEILGDERVMNAAPASASKRSRDGCYPLCARSPRDFAPFQGMILLSCLRVAFFLCCGTDQITRYGAICCTWVAGFCFLLHVAKVYVLDVLYICFLLSGATGTADIWTFVLQGRCAPRLFAFPFLFVGLSHLPPARHSYGSFRCLLPQLNSNY